MKFNTVALHIVIFVAATACASGPSERSELNPGSRCIDICSSEFTGCTQDPSNDYTSCATQRNQCNSDCRSQKAEEETTDSRGDVAPVGESMDNLSEDEMSDKEIQEEIVDDPLQGEGVSKEENSP